MCRAQDRFWRTSFLMLLVLSTVCSYPWKTWPFKTLIRIWFLCGDKGLSHSALCEVKVTGRSTEGLRSLYMVSAPQERLPLTMFLFFCFQVCPLNVWASGNLRTHIQWWFNVSQPPVTVLLQVFDSWMHLDFYDARALERGDIHTYIHTYIHEIWNVIKPIIYVYMYYVLNYDKW